MSSEASRFSEQDCLEAVKRSPAACAVHDKATWLTLFSQQGAINDPHGSQPHATQDQRDRFYETFIAPNGIHFDVHHDIVCGQTVLRDVTIQTTLSTGLVIDVPTHIRYELVEQDGGLKVEALHAYWELLPMVLGTLKTGFKGWVSYGKLTVHMLKKQGLGGVIGFMRGFFGVGRAGKGVAEQFLAALRDRDIATATTLVADGVVFSQAGQSGIRLQDLAQQLAAVSWDKLTMAGDSVSATIYPDNTAQSVDAVSSKAATGYERAVLLLRFDVKTRRIKQADLYY